MGISSARENFPTGAPDGKPDSVSNPSPPLSRAAAPAGVSYDPLHPGTSFLMADEERGRLTSLLASRYREGAVGGVVDEKRFLSWLSTCVVGPFREEVVSRRGRCFKQQKDLAPLVEELIGDRTIGLEEMQSLIVFWADRQQSWTKPKAVCYLMDVWDEWQAQRGWD